MLFIVTIALKPQDLFNSDRKLGLVIVTILISSCIICGQIENTKVLHYLLFHLVSTLILDLPVIFLACKIT